MSASAISGIVEPIASIDAPSKTQMDLAIPNIFVTLPFPCHLKTLLTVQATKRLGYVNRCLSNAFGFLAVSYRIGTKKRVVSFIFVS